MHVRASWRCIPQERGTRRLPSRCPEIVQFIQRCQLELPREDDHSLLQTQARMQRQQDANEFLGKLLCTFDESKRVTLPKLDPKQLSRIEKSLTTAS